MDWVWDGLTIAQKDHIKDRIIYNQQTVIN